MYNKLEKRAQISLCLNLIYDLSPYESGFTGKSKVGNRPFGKRVESGSVKVIGLLLKNLHRRPRMEKSFLDMRRNIFRLNGRKFQVWLLVSLLIAPVAIMGSSTSATAASKITTYKLLWSDEFTGKKGVLPSSKTWGFDLGGLNQNGELQFYTNNPQNISLNGSGQLVITAKRIADQSQMAISPDPAIEKMLNACNGCQFSSSRIKTAGKLSFQYGRMEIRMKSAAGEGSWPAFWMLGTDLLKGIPWPDAGEIDIFEGKGSMPSTAFGTIHGPGISGGGGLGSIYDNMAPYYSGYHIFAIEWKKNQIDFYADDNLYFSVTNKDVPSGSWVYNQPFFLILNLAMGGQFTGDIDPQINQSQISVDYIRYYAVNGIGKVFKK